MYSNKNNIFRIKQETRPIIISWATEAPAKLFITPAMNANAPAKGKV